MGRQSGDADKKMIAIGKEIARTQGCSALRVRDIVDKAGVNLGMFHYYFKSREKFVQILLKEVYGEFFSEMLTLIEHKETSLEQLREVLILVGLFLHKNRAIAISLIKDILNDDKQVIKYGSKNPPPHIEMIKELLIKCKKEKSITNSDFFQVMPLFFGAIAHPILVNEIILKAKKHKSPFDLEEMMSRKGINERVTIVLRGIGAKV